MLIFLVEFCLGCFFLHHSVSCPWPQFFIGLIDRPAVSARCLYSLALSALNRGRNREGRVVGKLILDFPTELSKCTIYVVNWSIRIKESAPIFLHSVPFCAAKPFSFSEPNHLIVLPRSLFFPDGKERGLLAPFRKSRRKVNFLPSERSSRNSADEHFLKVIRR